VIEFVVLALQQVDPDNEYPLEHVRHAVDEQVAHPAGQTHELPLRVYPELQAVQTFEEEQVEHVPGQVIVVPVEVDDEAVDDLAVDAPVEEDLVVVAVQAPPLNV